MSYTQEYDKVLQEHRIQTSTHSVVGAIHQQGRNTPFIPVGAFVYCMFKN